MASMTFSKRMHSFDGERGKSTIYQYFHRMRRYKRFLNFYLYPRKTKEVKNDV